MTPLPYPSQDPADIRAQSLDDARERIASAAKRWADATEVRARLVRTPCSQEFFDRACQREKAAREDFDILLSETFRAIKTDMDNADVPAIHDKP